MLGPYRDILTKRWQGKHPRAPVVTYKLAKIGVMGSAAERQLASL